MWLLLAKQQGYNKLLVGEPTVSWYLVMSTIFINAIVTIITIIIVIITTTTTIIIIIIIIITR